MGSTAKILKGINYYRDEITHVIDLLTKRHNTKKGMMNLLNQRFMGVAGIAVLVGVIAALFSGKLKGILKLALFAYTTKRSISHFLKK